MIRVNVDQAQQEFESLMADSMNGEVVVITEGDFAVTIEPILGAVIPGKVCTSADYVDTCNPEVE